METKMKDKPINLYKLMYDPLPKKQVRTDLPGPYYDLTVVVLGIVGAIGYFVLNLTR